MSTPEMCIEIFSGPVFPSKVTTGSIFSFSFIVIGLGESIAYGCGGMF